MATVTITVEEYDALRQQARDLESHEARGDDLGATLDALVDLFASGHRGDVEALLSQMAAAHVGESMDALREAEMQARLVAGIRCAA